MSWYDALPPNRPKPAQMIPKKFTFFPHNTPPLLHKIIVFVGRLEAQ